MKGGGGWVEMDGWLAGVCLIERYHWHIFVSAFRNFFYFCFYLLNFWWGLVRLGFDDI